jgi:hypothetical protein
MHSEILGFENASNTFPYNYLLEWEWPEHIELLIRRLVWARLVELTEATDGDAPAPSDYLAAKVCWLIASCPQTHPAVLDVLASTNCSAYAERIAENPRTAPSTLARLAGHPLPQVRCAVSENENTPVDVINILVQDEHVDVRYAMAENHNMAEDVLQTLSEDENCYVASRAKRTLNRLAPPSVVTMKLQRTQRATDTLKKVARG